MNNTIDFILGLLTIMCAVWIVIHVFINWKNNTSNEDKIKMLFKGGQYIRQNM